MKQDGKRNFFSAPRNIWEWLVIVIFLGSAAMGVFMVFATPQTPSYDIILLGPSEPGRTVPDPVEMPVAYTSRVGENGNGAQEAFGSDEAEESVRGADMIATTGAEHEDAD